jgi:hypothetical protein
MKLPYVYAFICATDDFAHALRCGIERRVSQDVADKHGRLILIHININQAVVRMAQGRIKEIRITGEESRFIKAMQKCDDFFIFHSTAAYIVAYLANWNSPTL